MGKGSTAKGVSVTITPPLGPASGWFRGSSLRVAESPQVDASSGGRTTLVTRSCGNGSLRGHEARERRGLGLRLRGAATTAGPAGPSGRATPCPRRDGACG